MKKINRDIRVYTGIKDIPVADGQFRPTFVHISWNTPVTRLITCLSWIKLSVSVKIEVLDVQCLGLSVTNAYTGTSRDTFAVLYRIMLVSLIHFTTPNPWNRNLNTFASTATVGWRETTVTDHALFFVVSHNVGTADFRLYTS